MLGVCAFSFDAKKLKNHSRTVWRTTATRPLTPAIIPHSHTCFHTHLVLQDCSLVGMRMQYVSCVFTQVKPFLTRSLGSFRGVRRCGRALSESGCGIMGSDTVFWSFCSSRHPKCPVAPPPSTRLPPTYRLPPCLPLFHRPPPTFRLPPPAADFVHLGCVFMRANGRFNYLISIFSFSINTSKSFRSCEWSNARFAGFCRKKE